MADPRTEPSPAARGLEEGEVPAVVEDVLREVLRATHDYAPGVEHERPSADTPRRGRSGRARDRSRDLIERLAARAGFARTHFDPDAGAAALARIVALGPGLQATYAQLADEASRRALLELLKLRVLGPYHASLRVPPAAYRAHQEQVDRDLRREAATFSTGDPFFPSLSLYEVPLPDGSPIRLHSHSVDVVSVYILGQYRYSRGDVVGAREGDIVFDVGACFGDTALLFAHAVGPSGRVYAFEFDPRNLEVLRANLALNPELAERIEVVERALWDRSGEHLSFSPAGRMTSLHGEVGGAAAGSASTITLDDFVSEADVARLDFVKMDVEGAELEVLSGGLRSLTEFTPRMALAAYHRDDDLVRIPALIHSLQPSYRLWLDSFSPVEAETVLFAAPASSST